MINRRKTSLITLSATSLAALLAYEGYREKAYIPVPGDVPTIGFGTTEGVKLGDKTDPVKAVSMILRDVQKFEGALKQCVKVPLSQNEYDAYLSLSYNIGPTAFCGSTLVKRLNLHDYDGACEQILRWDKFKGRPLAGLTKRRRAEYETCIKQDS